jgi:hypothetical protein
MELYFLSFKEHTIIQFTEDYTSNIHHIRGAQVI